MTKYVNFTSVVIAIGLGLVIGTWCGIQYEAQMIQRDFAKQGVAKYEVDGDGNPQWKLNCILKSE